MGDPQTASSSAIGATLMPRTDLRLHRALAAVRPAQVLRRLCALTGSGPGSGMKVVGNAPAPDFGRPQPPRDPALHLPRAHAASRAAAAAKATRRRIARSAAAAQSPRPAAPAAALQPGPSLGFVAGADDVLRRPVREWDASAGFYSSPRRCFPVQRFERVDTLQGRFVEQCQHVGPLNSPPPIAAGPDP